MSSQLDIAALKKLRTQLRVEEHTHQQQAIEQQKQQQEAQSAADLFRQHVGAITPIPPTHQRHSAPTTPLPIPRHSVQAITSINSSLSDEFEPDLPTDETNTTHYFRPGTQSHVLRRLRKGYWPIQETLDLHGCTQTEARTNVEQFLHHANQRQYRCVRIIHGKGTHSPNHTSVLKEKIYRWLVQTESVLAFCPAKEINGGTGATMILLSQS